MTKPIQWHSIALFLTSIFLITSVGCGAAPTIEPTPSEVATVTNDLILAISPVSIPLSGEWRFSIDKDQEGEGQGWAKRDFDDSSWATVQVPHTWNVMQDYSEYEGFAWYRQLFTIPAESRDAHLRLRFEAVFYLARVWLNGQYLGQHEGGYTPFEFDVTSIVKPGEKNVIAIQIDNLRWAVTSPNSNTKFSEGDIPLSALAPALQWSGVIKYTAPIEEYIITVSIIRPTGYSVIERSYSTKGELIL